MTALRRLTTALGVVLAAAALAACGTIPEAAPPMPSGAGAGTPSGPASADASSTAGPSSSPGTATCEYTQTGTAARPVHLPPAINVPDSGTVTYVMKMDAGDVRITMDRAKAPCTVNSFVSLADQGYFNDTRCHRLADSGIFILQCGDPTATGSGGPGYQFANETDGTESYRRGVVAMANAGPGTNGSQFFLIWDDSTGLDGTPDYTIFGRMDKASTDVIAGIASQGQDGSMGANGGTPNAPAKVLTVAPR